MQYRRRGGQAHHRHADRQQESRLVGRLHLLRGESATVSLRETWKVQEVSRMPAHGITPVRCEGADGLPVCPLLQVLYSLQRPVLRLGVRGSLQTGGWEHQVSSLVIKTATFWQVSFALASQKRRCLYVTTYWDA